MAIGNFPEIVQNNKISNSSASAGGLAIPNRSSESNSVTASSSNGDDSGIEFVESNAAKITDFNNLHRVSNAWICTKDGFNDSNTMAIIESLKKNYSFHLRSISNNHDDADAFAFRKIMIDTSRQYLFSNFGGDTADDTEVPPLTDDDCEMPPLTDDESDTNVNDQNDGSDSSNNTQNFNGNNSNNNNDDEDEDGVNKKNNIDDNNTADSISTDEDDASKKDINNNQPLSSNISTSPNSDCFRNSLRTHIARSQVMFLLVRIVCNSLVNQFPIDTCCNNKNNLMLKNLIAFVKTAISRSKASLNEFLISYIYLMRFALKYKKFSNFTNNSKTKNLCLRRLILTCLIISVSRTRKSYKFGDNTYSITSFWSLLSGLANKELAASTIKFKTYVGRDALSIQECDLINYKVRLNRLTKMMIRSEY